jgi:hypothetical protein
MLCTLDGWRDGYPDEAIGIALDDGNGIILNGILYKPALLHGPYAIHRIRTCVYHRQYCRCDVTGRSGSAVHSLRLSRFFLSSSEMRIRVFSSLRSTEKPIRWCQRVIRQNKLVANSLVVRCFSMLMAPRALNSGVFQLSPGPTHA